MTADLARLVAIALHLDATRHIKPAVAWSRLPAVVQAEWMRRAQVVMCALRSVR